LAVGVSGDGAPPTAKPGISVGGPDAEGLTTAD
jgi:hypothetical protein